MSTVMPEGLTGEVRKSPRRTVALIVALLAAAGAGHFVLGRYRRGLFWFALRAGAILLSVICMLTISPSMIWPLAGVALLVGIASIIDVARLPAREAAQLPGWGKTILLVLALIAIDRTEMGIIRATWMESFKIPSASMSPTILAGDHIFISKVAHDPTRGELIVFQSPQEPDKVLVKRVVAIAGDTLEAREGVLWLNGRAVDHHPVGGDGWQESLDGVSYSVVIDKGRGLRPRSFPALKVPPNSVYVMGDNRDHSDDSRLWGPVDARYIKGRALSVWWSSGDSGIRWERIGRKLQ